jgi:hypothetical protein
MITNFLFVFLFLFLGVGVNTLFLGVFLRPVFLPKGWELDDQTFILIFDCSYLTKSLGVFTNAS